MADEKKEALALEEKAIRASFARALAGLEEATCELALWAGTGGHRPPPEDVAVKAQQLRDNAVALYRLQVWRTRFG